MVVDRLWNTNLLLLAGCLITGYLAMFANGENGNALWYLLFWALSTALFCLGGWMTALLFRLRESFAAALVGVLGLVGFYCSSPLGLMAVFGLLTTGVFFVWIVILLAVVKITALGNASAPQD